MGAQGARQVESGNEWATPWWVVNGYNDADSGGTFPSQTLILRPERRKDDAVPTLLRPVPSSRNEAGRDA